MEREVRRDLTEMAERHAVDVFARNLRSLLLQPPILNQTVLAIDPGFRTGCKLAVLDGRGNLLEQGVIHPHPPQNRRSEAKLLLKDLVGKHSVNVVAIGNGTACRETEELIAEIIHEGTTFIENPEAAAEAEAKAQAHAAAHAAPAPPPQEAEPQTDSPPSPATAEEPTPASEPEAATAAEEAKPDLDGVTQHPSEEPAEALPPIAGGAPEEGESAAPPTEPESAPPHAATEVIEEHQPVEATSATAPEHEPPPAESVAQTQSEAPDTKSEASTGDMDSETDSTPIVVAPAAVSGATPPAGLRPSSGGGKPQHKHQEPRQPRPKPVPMPPRPHAADTLLAQMAYVIVNEAGASVYSASPIGREEFPDFDATLRGTISIGRRLQDPLAELVKIEPQSIGVGLYQHDVNPKQLKESLESVIASCVNFVGVDVNTASVPLLRHVSGLNQLTARRLVERRTEKGPFTDRSQISEIEGVGPVTFTQAAGFLKIRDGESPLDRTWVHPESYPVAARLLEKIGFTPDVFKDKEQLGALQGKLAEADVPTLARELEVGELTLSDILEALARPDRDPREDLPKPIFKKGVLKLEDLQPGMELKGTVLNVVDFGAFVDIGLKDSGLVHISQLANRYIKSPHDVVSVGDVVTAWVMGVDQERKRVSLTMVKPGTERPRGAPGGGPATAPGPRRGRGPGAPPGGERRPNQGPGQGQGQGRPPRREGPPSALTAPPTGGAHTAPPEGRSGDTQPAGPIPRTEHRPAGGGQRPGGPGGRGPGGPPGRGGPRFGFGPGGPRRQEPAQTPRPPARPPRPAPPPPPLPKDALAGNIPLRSFGQLKQLWQARTEDAPTEGQSQPPTETSPQEPATPAAPDAPAPPAENPPPASEETT